MHPKRKRRLLVDYRKLLLRKRKEHTTLCRKNYSLEHHKLRTMITWVSDFILMMAWRSEGYETCCIVLPYLRIFILNSSFFLQYLYWCWLFFQIGKPNTWILSSYYILNEKLTKWLQILKLENEVLYLIDTVRWSFVSWWVLFHKFSVKNSYLCLLVFK